MHSYLSPPSSSQVAPFAQGSDLHGCGCSVKRERETERERDRDRERQRGRERERERVRRERENEREREFNTLASGREMLCSFYSGVCLLLFTRTVGKPF